VAAAAELMAVVATTTAVTTATTMAAIVVAAATLTATAVGGKDNGGDSDGRGHRQQSTKIGSKDMVAVTTAMETAAAGAATTATGAPTTAPGIGADVGGPELKYLSSAPFFPIFGLTAVLKILSFRALALGDNIADLLQLWHQKPILQIVTLAHSPACYTGSRREMLRQSHWKTQIEGLTNL
jgi:hypothetical protein